jgi:hypothetical protein
VDVRLMAGGRKRMAGMEQAEAISCPGWEALLSLCRPTSRTGAGTGGAWTIAGSPSNSNYVVVGSGSGDKSDLVW